MKRLSEYEFTIYISIHRIQAFALFHVNFHFHFINTIRSFFLYFINIHIRTILLVFFLNLDLQNVRFSY